MSDHIIIDMLEDSNQQHPSEVRLTNLQNIRHPRQWEGPYHQELSSKLEIWPELSHILRFSATELKTSPIFQVEPKRQPKLIVANFDEGGTTNIIKIEPKSFPEAVKSTPSYDHGATRPNFRLIIAPDLSYDTMETLGHTLDLNPEVFLTHICDVTNILELSTYNYKGGRENFISPGISIADSNRLGVFKIDCKTSSTIHDIIPSKKIKDVPAIARQRRWRLENRPVKFPGLRRKFRVPPQLFTLPYLNNVLHETIEISLDFMALDRMTVCYKLHETVPTSKPKESYSPLEINGVR